MESTGNHEIGSSTLRLDQGARMRTEATGDDDALQALRALKDADKVIPIDVDEEPKDTFWRRI